MTYLILCKATGTGAGILGNLSATLSDPAETNDDEYARKVAMSDSYALVGSKSYGPTDTGRAYIYNTAGTLLHTLENPNDYDTIAYDQFGDAVAISDSYAIVGAALEDDAGGADSGKVYIFNVATGSYIRTIDNPTSYGTNVSDQFGTSVDISGNHIIIGAPFEDDASGNNSGKAFVYDVTDGSLVQTFDNPNDYDTGTNDNFGKAVAIDGNIAVVGSHLEDEISGYLNVGRVYVFNVSTGALLHTIVNPNPHSAPQDDYFAWDLAISGDNIVVGAYQEDLGTAGAGIAYVFSASTGGLLHTLNNPNASGFSSDYFGYSVDIDGDRIVVGAYRDDEPTGINSGSAFIFKTSDGSLIKTLANPNAYGTADDDRFGFSVAVGGTHVIVGAYFEDSATTTNSGKAYIFE